jgi:hypothetical protein
MVFVTSETGASAGGGSPGGRGSIAVAVRHVGTEAVPKVTTIPTVTYPPNDLCAEFGFEEDSTVQVNGKRFGHNKAVKVLYDGKTVANATTLANGTFTTTFEDFQHPIGVYILTAKRGTAVDTVQLPSSAQSCWDAQGLSGDSLAWRWSASGLDANTSATIKVAGTAIKTVTTNAKGQLYKEFHAQCPVGLRPVTMVVSLQGAVQELSAGNANC